ncbi:acyl-CoA thioesterase [Clostridium sp. YIM B02515]|uniref:Acyl-CoA thioesterase n=1 Tax=Clostridium rhizosphaerae TaxID=2803861 RepID=A0ABS1T7F2_9CLOT|nr:thioesterase family protein [Clostridium rhizosphaerae]MBL4934596.1 acyl-CoA thioesterase [Clostridium rhizosphaerae]
MYKSTTELKVRYAETDQMGIVHHSNYYVYFEAAREDFILGAGISYKEIEDRGIMMPLVETQCRYIEGAKYADELIIETSLQELSPVKVVLEYKVIRVEDGRLISKGKTIQTFVDSRSFKIVNLKRYNTDLWERFERLK